MYNPRFPHTLQIRRPQYDEYGEIIFDSEGNPSYINIVLNVAVYNSEQIPIKDSSGNFITEEKTTISFGYRDNNRAINAGQVDIAQLHIATPLFIDSIENGDRLILTDWDRTYIAEVVRKSNTNFGTNIWLNEVKN